MDEPLGPQRCWPHSYCDVFDEVLCWTAAQNTLEQLKTQLRAKVAIPAAVEDQTYSIASIVHGRRVTSLPRCSDILAHQCSHFSKPCESPKAQRSKRDP
jgi:hypothetical protein